MKILHLGKYYPPAPGGMERFLQDLAEEQCRQGHQVQVLCHQHRPTGADARVETAQTVAQATVAENHCPVVYRQPAWGPILHTPLMRAARRRLRAVLDQFQPDVIHLHWPNPVALWWLPILKSQSAPVVVQWHSDTVTENVSALVKTAHVFLRPLERALLRQTKMAVCSSDAYAAHSPILQKAAPAQATIPLGMAFTGRLAEGSDGECGHWAERQWQGQGIRLLSLGRLSFYKNLPALLQAVALSRQDGGPAVQAVIAGDGPMADRWQALSHTLGVQDSVVFTGKVSQAQANALFASCDAFALLSNDRAESFGLVLLEALWHGKPLVVANTLGSGMRSVLDAVNKITPAGFLCEPESAADVLMKTRQAAQLGHRPDFSAQIRQAVESAFAMPSVCQQWTRLYQSVLNA